MRFRRFVVLTFLIALVAAACGGDADDETVAGDPTTTTEARLDRQCETDAYSVRFPGDWHVADDPEDEPCEWFNPEEFDLPEATEATEVAIHLNHPVDAPFDELVADAAESPAVDQVLRRDDVTVAGHEAVRVETVASGEALLPQGARSYTYFVADVDGAVMVASTTSLGEGDYEENQAVLDEMMSSLTTA